MKNLLTGIFIVAVSGMIQLGAQEAKAPAQTLTVQGNKLQMVELDPAVRAEDEWTPFQVVFLPGLPSYSRNSNTHGIKSGWPATSGVGRVNGIEISWCYSGTDIIKGIQASWLINDNVAMDGLQISWILNMNGQVFRGVQGSCVVNIAGDFTGLQCGGFNKAGDFTGFQPGVFGNIANEFTGFQLGLYNVAGSLRGFQMSGVNVAGESDGFQLGFVNVAKNRGVQFGLLNIIQGSPLPVFPFFNICF
jgi:hypothetical protein